jgi:hypothetical protein
MCPRDATRSRAVNNCDETNTERNYNTKESDNFLHKSKQ